MVECIDRHREKVKLSLMFWVLATTITEITLGPSEREQVRFGHTEFLMATDVLD